MRLIENLQTIPTYVGGYRHFEAIVFVGHNNLQRAAQEMLDCLHSSAFNVLVRLVLGPAIASGRQSLSEELLQSLVEFGVGVEAELFGYFDFGLVASQDALSQATFDLNCLSFNRRDVLFDIEVVEHQTGPVARDCLCDWWSRECAEVVNCDVCVLSDFGRVYSGEIGMIAVGSVNVEYVADDVV